jgi:beta-lactamase regulating signal transducer with metallopeptidase domain
MSPTFESWLVWVAASLLEGSISGAVVIALVWVVCRRVRSIPPSARAMLWWLASLKLVVALLPLPSFGVAVLPAIPVLSTAIVASPVTSLDPPPLVVDTPTVVAAREPLAAPTRPTVPIAVVTLWFGGVTVLAVHLFATYVGLRRTVRRSSPAGPGETEMVARLAGLLALRRVPTIRVSSEVRTPVVIGIVRPDVLLPAAEIAALEPGEREMAICHELAHVRRRDLALGWIPAIAERLFFFHPLARLAAREYVAEREAACDALVVDVLDVAPRDYGQMLVRLGIGRVRPVFTATGAASSTSSLRRRLDMLQDSTPARPRRGWMILFAVLALATVVPFQFIARSIQAPETVVQAAPMPAPAQRAPAQPAAVPVQKPAPTVAPRQVTRADEKPLREAVAEQRDQMRETERALIQMRKQLEELLVRTEMMRKEIESNAGQRVLREQVQAVSEQQRAERAATQREQQAPARESATPQEEMRRLVEERQRSVRTQQMLEDRLRALIIEQETIDRRLRELGEEIKGVRQQLDGVR